jgi:hypothetical protein
MVRRYQQIQKLLLLLVTCALCEYVQCTLQRTNNENSKHMFPEKELRGHSPNFQIQVSVADLYIPTIGLPILLQEICGPILGIFKSLTDT